MDTLQQNTVECHTRTSRDPTHSRRALSPVVALDAHKAVLAPALAPGISRNPVPRHVSRGAVLPVASDQQGVIGTLLALGNVENSTAIRQESRVRTVETDRDWSNVSQGQFHVSFVIGRYEAPGFHGCDWMLDQFGPALVLKANVRILIPGREAISVDKVEGKQWIPAGTALIRGCVTVEKLLHGQIEHLKSILFDTLRVRNGLLVPKGSVPVCLASRLGCECLVGIVCLPARRTRFERSVC